MSTTLLGLFRWDGTQLVLVAGFGDPPAVTPPPDLGGVFDTAVFDTDTFGAP